MPRAVEAIEEEGVAYTDEEGDLVTTIIDGRNCAFSCYAEGGQMPLCYRQGLSRRTSRLAQTHFVLSLSSATHGIPHFTAVNYHRWKICRPAVANGKRLGIRLYQAMKEPLIARFGPEWYAELCEACEAWLEQQK